MNVLLAVVAASLCVPVASAQGTLKNGSDKKVSNNLYVVVSSGQISEQVRAEADHFAQSGDASTLSVSSVVDFEGGKLLLAPDDPVLSYYRRRIALFSFLSSYVKNPGVGTSIPDGASGDEVMELVHQLVPNGYSVDRKSVKVGLEVGFRVGRAGDSSHTLAWRPKPVDVPVTELTSGSSTSTKGKVMSLGRPLSTSDTGRFLFVPESCLANVQLGTKLEKAIARYGAERDLLVRQSKAEYRASFAGLADKGGVSDLWKAATSDPKSRTTTEGAMTQVAQFAVDNWKDLGFASENEAAVTGLRPGGLAMRPQLDFVIRYRDPRSGTETFGVYQITAPEYRPQQEPP